MIKIIILEDEDDAAKKLKEHIDRFSKEQKLAFDVKRFDNGVALLESYAADADIILMDIQMPMLNGMETARKIRARDENVIIVFVTNLAQYAIEGYEVGACDFILKPVRYTGFAMKLERICRSLARKLNNGAALNILAKDGMRRIIVCDIVYAEVINHDVSIYLVGGEVVRKRGSLTKLAEELNDKRFAFCNSCYLVNLDFVNGVDGDFVTVSGHKLRVSQPKRRAFLQEVAKFFGGTT